MRQTPPKISIFDKTDYEELYRIWSIAFEQGSRGMDHWRRATEALPEGTVFAGVRDHGGVQAALGVISFRCYFGHDTVLPMGGIANVATLPGSRGKGYAGALLDYALGAMRESGQLVSLLGPFSYAFYQNYGWDWIGMARHYSLPARAVKTSKEADRVREATTADRAALREVYAHHSRRYRGAIARTDTQWSDLLDDTEGQYTSTYLHEVAGGVDGYITYRGGSRESLGLREFVALTPEAQSGLLGLLRRLEMQFGRFAWKAPADDILWSQFYDWEIETKIQPVIMGRVVDVAGALAAWQPEEGCDEGTLTLSVHDPHAPWNTGTWRITCESGTIVVEHAHGEGQVSLDIRAFSQAYFGQPTLDELRRAGRVAVSDKAAFKTLSRLLAGPAPWLNDYF